VRDINRLKREYNESKLEITILENNNRKMREDMNEQVQASCEAGLKEICKGISVEIK
jgi:C4-dicarboxylate-specific signal transduction histidine kinase